MASILGVPLERARAEKPHRALQDTNDASLANLAKDGTRPVVPRILGGRSPRRAHHHRRGGAQVRPPAPRSPAASASILRRLGRPAPAIRGELVAAGLRRVRPTASRCAHREVPVGSTWCRCWVQDSMTPTQTLSTATRGCGHPQAEFAVSGCTRECRGPEQGHRRHRHRAGWNPCVWQRRHAAALMPTLLPRIRRADRSATSTGCRCSTCAPGTGCNVPGLDGEHKGA